MSIAGEEDLHNAEENAQISDGQSGDAKTRVLLADDHPFIRIGIRNILEKAGDIRVIGEASDGLQAVQMVQDLHPDILLLDIEMPGLMGIEVARKVKAMQLGTQILALSAHEDRQFILGMLSCGAAGYLVKEEVPEAVVEAVRGISQGKYGWISQQVAARLGIWLQREESGCLSPRDTQVLSLLVAGKHYSEIGAALGMNEDSVADQVEQTLNLVREKILRIG